jgi:hypothetical protein
MISNTAPVANGWGVTDIVTSVECDISRPGRKILTAYCQEDARCSQDLRSSCRNRSSADLPDSGTKGSPRNSTSLIRSSRKKRKS